MSRQVIAVLASVGVLVGFGDMPYGYYTLLRFAISGFSLFLVFGDQPTSTIWQRWLTGAVAVLYNPIVPVHLGEKDIWSVINVATVVWFWFLAYSAPRSR